MNRPLKNWRRQRPTSQNLCLFVLLHSRVDSHWLVDLESTSRNSAGIFVSMNPAACHRLRSRANRKPMWVTCSHSSGMTTQCCEDFEMLSWGPTAMGDLAFHSIRSRLHECLFRFGRSSVGESLWGDFLFVCLAVSFNAVVPRELCLICSFWREYSGKSHVYSKKFN